MNNWYHAEVPSIAEDDAVCTSFKPLSDAKINNLFVSLLPVSICKNELPSSKYLKFCGISNPVRSIGIDGAPKDLLLQFLIDRDNKLNCGSEPFPYSLKFDTVSAMSALLLDSAPFITFSFKSANATLSSIPLALAGWLCSLGIRSQSSLPLLFLFTHLLPRRKRIICSYLLRSTLIT